MSVSPIIWKNRSKMEGRVNPRVELLWHPAHPLSAGSQLMMLLWLHWCSEQPIHFPVTNGFFWCEIPHSPHPYNPSLRPVASCWGPESFWLGQVTQRNPKSPPARGNWPSPSSCSGALAFRLFSPLTLLKVLASWSCSLYGSGEGPSLSHEGVGKLPSKQSTFREEEIVS